MLFVLGDIWFILEDRKVRCIMVFRFILTALFVGIISIGASVVWPYVSSSPRPDALGKIYSAVGNAPIIAQTEGVVSSLIPPQTKDNLGSVAGAAASALVESVGESAKDAALNKALDEVLKQWDALPQDKRTRIQEKICREQ